MERLRVSAKIDTDEVRSDGQDEDGNEDGEGAAVQGGLRIKKIYPGLNFFLRPYKLDLPTYVIRHVSIYGNVTSST